MPELFRLFGFVFMFFSNDHEPIHIHAVGNDGFVKLELQGAEFVIVECKNVKSNDRKRIIKAANENVDIITARWNEFFNVSE